MWRHWIQAIFSEDNGAWHHPYKVEKKIKEYEEQAIARIHDNFPDYFIELEAASREAGLTVGQLCLALADFN